MRIAINIGGFLLGDEEWNGMVKSLFQHLASKWPIHQFVFFSDNFKNDLTTSSNVSNIVLANPSNNRLALKLWYDYKLTSFLKKEKIDVFINPDAVSSLRSTIPQVLLINPSFYSSISNTRNGFIKKRLLKSLKKASAIIGFDSSEKKQQIEGCFISDEKVTVANLFSNSISKPKDWQENELTKDKYSEGKEYFLYRIGDNPMDILTLLKAFSLFKKRQQSNMQLLIVGKMGRSAKNFTTKIAAYKYRNEVKLLDILPQNEMLCLLAATYCLLHFLDAEIDLPLLNAKQIGIPVIVLKTNFTIETQYSTALYADANNAASIAEQMKIIYKDENLRSTIITTGLAFALQNTVEKTVAQVWPVIYKASGKD